MPQFKFDFRYFLDFSRVDALLRIPPRSGDLYASLMCYLLGWCIVVINDDCNEQSLQTMEISKKIQQSKRAANA